MAVSSTTNTVALLGNNSSVVFAYPYKFFSQSDLNVYLYDTLLGGIIQQTLNNQFSVSGTANAQGIYPNGANVVFNSSIANTTYVVIDRQPVQVQSFNVLQTGVIPSTGLVNQFDYLTLLVQALQDRINSAVALPLGYGNAAFVPALPTNIGINPGAYLAVNSAATGFTLIGSSGVGYGGTNLVLTGNGSTAPATFQALPAVSLASGVVGTLSLSNGGTGGLVPSTWGVVYASSATQLATTAPGPAGYVLTANASAAPSYQQITLNAAEITGVLAAVNGGTGSAMVPYQWGVVVGSSATGLGMTPPGSAGQHLIANASGIPTFQTYTPSLSNASGVLAIAQGGTGQVTANTGFNALSPMTTIGDFIYGGASGVGTRLAVGSSGTVLQSFGAGSPGWVQPFTYTSNQYGLIVSGSSNFGAGVIPANSSISLPLISQGTAANPAWALLPIAGGGTGQSTANTAFNALSPMTAFGDMIYAGSAAVATRLAAGSSGTVLSSFGPGQQPGWIAATAGLAYTANQYGLVVSGSSNLVQNVIPANSSVSLPLISQGAAANPAWAVLPVAGGGTGSVGPYTSQGLVYASSATVMETLAVNSSASRGFMTQKTSGLPAWFLPTGQTSQVFTVPGSGTYTPTAGVTAFKVYATGGGGGGGGTATNTTTVGCGAGGGGGGTAIKFISGSTIFNSYPYVIGAGGPGGASGNNSGITGSSTFFGSSVLLQALIGSPGTGGGGGAAITGPGNTTGGAFGTGGVPVGGDINLVGDVGSDGQALSATGQNQSGKGGSSMWGPGAPPRQSSGGGASATNYGSGGAGGAQNNNGGNQTGGNALQGIIIIEEFYA